MKHFTQSIPLDLAEKLKAAGMPITEVQHDVQGMIYADYAATYGEVFDWLLSEKNLNIWFLPTWKSRSDPHVNYKYRITRMVALFKEHTDDVSYSWHEAANAAIERALELLK